ncbi:pilus assembly PilX N-terminal domain-containing protein [Halanaerobium hydrogeniformans]|uniref:Type 4 fimbrial biogenesis protein PilX N-terminal domain-containing protein n=1 Tax=Halanaerobium hydrogeniformans TaxID=656519 RepID=E4RLF3_HALHG|nr:pilus assembly PilX N-terminal domain-containing protein [Halanaerobium hydrogeniformans]ADQ14867.1 hypothetical protein Halsa_1440 [Halanaerobium hydrogeniformans]
MLKIKSEDGAVLVLSIIIILVLTVLVTALVGSINSNISFTKRHENDIKAYYAAEAGIEQGINVLLIDRENIDNYISDNSNDTDDEDYIKDYKNDSFNDFESFELRVKEGSGDDEYDFKSIGSSGSDVTKIIYTTININSEMGAGMFNNALTTEGDLNIDLSDWSGDDETKITGDIYASQLGVDDKFSFAKGELLGDIYANEIGVFENSGMEMNGNIYADQISKHHGQKFAVSGGKINNIYANEIGTFEMSDSDFITGGVHTFSIDANQSFIEPKSLENEVDSFGKIIPDFSEYFENDGNVYLGNENNPDYDGSVIELEGNKEYNNFNKDGSGIIVVNGDLDIKNNIKANKDNDEDFLIILVDGDISTSMHIEGNVFMYASGKINIDNTPGGSSQGQGNPGKFEVNGSFMAEEGITINDSRNQGLNLTHNDKFVEIFEDIGYGIPQLGSNNSGSSGSSSTSIEIVKWQED